MPIDDAQVAGRELLEAEVNSISLHDRKGHSLNISPMTIAGNFR